jgi:glycosidase
VQNPVPNGDRLQNGSGKFNDLSDKAINAIKNLGFSHIWLTGVIKHASQSEYSIPGFQAAHPATVKGKAGSPYAISDFFELDPDLAENPENRWTEFHECRSRIQNAGLKLIIDFVPNHTARQYSSIYAKNAGLSDLGEKDRTDLEFHPENNYYYSPGQELVLETNQQFKDNPFREFPAKATGNDCFSAHPSIFDWYETVKLNYGVNYQNGERNFDPIPPTWKYMLEVLKFWANKKVDGFRCDMVEMVPVEFWAWAIPQIKESDRKLDFIAEVYNPDLYQTYLHIGKFDYLYDKVGLYDCLRELVEGGGDCNKITGVWQKQEGFENRMLRFMENHDEQRIASEKVGKDAFRALHNGHFCVFGQRTNNGLFWPGTGRKSGRTLRIFW